MKIFRSFLIIYLLAILNLLAEDQATNPIELYANGHLAGEVRGQFKNDGSLISIERESFYQIVAPLLITPLNMPTKESITLDEINANLKDANLIYKIEELSLFLTINSGSVKGENLSLLADSTLVKRQGIPPANFSGHLNYEMRESVTQNSSEQSNFNLFTEAALSHNEFTILSQQNYSDSERLFSRRESKLVFDSEKDNIRYQIGDISYKTIGAQSFVNMGGISIAREFSIDPTSPVTPINEENFYLDKEANVEIFVNDILVKTVDLLPGNHKITDLPLSSGVNEVRLKINERNGISRVVILRKSNSQEMLRKGVSEFSINVGEIATMEMRGPSYNKDHLGLFSSLFYKRGISDYFTASLYGQGTETQHLYGINQIWALPIGIIPIDIALSEGRFHDIKQNGGMRTTLGIEVETLGQSWKRGKTVTATWQYNSKFFTNPAAQPVESTMAHRFDLSLGHTLPWQMSLNAGFFYLINRIGINGYGSNLSATKRFFNSFQTTANISRQKNFQGNWDDYLYLFISIPFPAKNQYATTSYDSKQTLHSDWKYNSPNVYNGVNSAVSVEDQPLFNHEQNLLEYKHSKFTLRGDQDFTINKIGPRQVQGKSSLQLSGALLFAENQLALSRPINGSFALFKTSEKLDGRIYINGQGSEKSDHIKKGSTAVLTDLRPYYPFTVRADGTDLPPNERVISDTITLLPKNSSGHLITLVVEKQVVLTATLVNSDGIPYALSSGFISNQNHEFSFFTNREGRIIVEGLKPGSWTLSLENKIEKIIDIPEGHGGIYEVGNITIK